MRRLLPRRLLIACFLVFSALTVFAQEQHPYFSLSSERTFLPGEKPTIRAYARDVDVLEFRVYHVNDPEKFFSQLKSVHNFGEARHTEEREQIEEKSWLERFHDWKRSLWRAIRDFFRRQFSSDSRSLIRQKQAEKQKSTRIGQATLFAQVPVLNSSQLMARWRQEVPPKYFSETQEIPLDSLKGGVYVVEATDGHLRAYTVVIVSQMGLITKSASGQVLAFAADRKSGAPIEDATVVIWSHDKEIFRGKSDDHGLAEAKLTALGGESYENTWVLATYGDDVAIVAPYSFNLSSDPWRDWAGYIYTDRPVFRPGHTVHFKAILREREGESWRIPKMKEAQVVLEDPTSKQVYQKTLPLDGMGTLHGDYDVPANAALGYYSITVRTPAGSSMNGGFHVEEYKKPEYEVKVTPDKMRVLEGESVTATIEARYYFGEPVAGAEVTYVVHTMPYWSPYIDRYENEDSGMSAGEEGGGEGDEGDGYEAGYYGGEQESEQKGKLDADGKLRIKVPTRVDDRKQDVRYRIEARVMDAANREISGANSVIATYGDYQISVRPDSYVYQMNQSARVNVVARDYDGKPVKTTVHLELRRWAWQGKGREQVPPEQAQDVTTGADGNAVATFHVTTPGSYWVEARAKATQNRDLRATGYLWVAGPGEQWWGAENRQIKLIADKPKYQPGDTAHVLVLSGMPHAYALVTTEGRDIQSKRIVELRSPSETIDVPITSDNQPNIYLAVAFLADNALYQAAKNLKVPATDKQLRIEISPTKETFTPGEKASYVINVKDSSGKPVQGEFSIGVVDEAIYAIKPDTSGDMMQTFFGSVYNAVSTESSLTFYFSGQAGEKPMQLANRTANYSQRALAQLKPNETLVAPKIRKNFPDTALWQPDFRTDAKGFAIANLVFPDSLTTWRATVRGITLDTKVGSAINRIIVRKNVMVRLAVPRFFRDGDEVVISVLVHNYLKSGKSAQVSLDVSGLEVIGGSTQTLTVPSRGEVKADWRVRAGKIRKAVLTAKALTNEESDAMELTLPVVPYGVKLADANSGAITTPQGRAESTINFPAQTDASAHALEVNMTPSVAGSIFGALDYLTSYPYGCTEQTMSSFLPDIVVAQAMKELKLETSVNSPELERKIRAGLDRLYDFQHDDGGWGWWKEDESHVFMTAYVVSGLAQARGAGYDVKAGAIENGKNWLRGSIAKYPRMRPDLHAYVLYALAAAGERDPKMVEAVWEKRERMNTQGLAFLGLALHAIGDMRAAQIADRVEKQATVLPAEVYWSADFDYLMEFRADDAAETTAYAVRLLSLMKPDSPLLPKATFWLISHRNGGYYWDSTKQTAMVVFGLTEYLRVSRELDANFDAAALVNSKQVAAKHFSRADVFDPSAQPHVSLGPEQLQPTSNNVLFTKSGAGRLYWSTRAEYYSTDKRMFQSNKLSLNITRDYFRLAQVTEKGKIVYDLVPLSGELHPGDVLAVRLTVSGSEWRYLMIEDPIPAGAEFLQKDSLYEIRNRPSWWESYWSRREFHDDRAAIFQTYFDGDRAPHHYFYLLKIVNPGKYRVSPASVQPMYQPSIISTTDAATVEVK
ncbi:MAG: MG2 domain-containing protein [Acidobacteriota bacterium]|nr:MG2 domain-containing protein [Acidobacteriota bacterium]